jgi:DNA polymerase-3 subunit epsilon
MARLVFNFGPHRGEALDQVASEDPGFLRWMLNKDFSDDVKKIVRSALGAGSGPKEAP